MKIYTGCKSIQAEPMGEFTFMIKYKDRFIKGGTSRPGYKIIYPDGYIDWLSKEVFENAYKKITNDDFITIPMTDFDTYLMTVSGTYYEEQIEPQITLKETSEKCT